jgi:thymidylate kinase
MKILPTDFTNQQLSKIDSLEQASVMPRPVIVEFVGMMGSGKSTIASLVIEELNRRGYSCPSQKQIVSWMTKSGFNNSCESPGIIEKLKYYSKLSYLLAALRFPRIAFSAYRYALTVQPKNKDSLQTSRAPMYWMGILEKYTQNTLYDVVLFEEATLQYINDVPLYGKQFSRNAQKELISKLIEKENHLVVFLKIDADSVRERIKGRAAEAHSENMQSWAFEHEAEDYQRQKITHAIDIFESTLKHLKALSPRSLIEIDALKEPKVNAALVVECIEKLVQSR